MTDADDALSRPEFETVDLDVDVDEAQRRIEDAMKGLFAAETSAGTKYRTTDGMLVAILAARPSGSGEPKARLAYRTDPPSESATRKAAKISEALAGHTITA